MAAARLAAEPERVRTVGRHHVVDIGAERQALGATLALARHRDGDKRVALDRDRHFLHRRDEIEAVVFAPQHGGEQLHEGFPANGPALVIPGAVPGDFEPDIPANIKVWQ